MADEQTAKRVGSFLEFASQRMEMTQAEALAVIGAMKALSSQGPAFWEAMRVMGLRRYTDRQQLAYSAPAQTEMQRSAWLGQALEAKEMHTILRSRMAQVLRLEKEFSGEAEPSERLEW